MPTRATSVHSSSDLASGYRSVAGVADEMLDASGDVRPHWQGFTSSIKSLGTTGLLERWADARRLLHENGVTHNVYGAADGLDRPWSLDPIPLLLPEHEWTSICGALEQRARLLDAFLADLYSDARTIYEHVLPSDLIWANAGFLRACHGVRPPQNRWLHLYSADLVRGHDGSFLVLSDRTQNPSGAGYSLENRIILSRTLPTAYQQCNVQRLAPFFIRLRDSLASLAPSHRRDNPRVVLLTPGPYNETYFEHAYLARYLGYQLVQGSDLTVRDSVVYLKTLGGLQRIDVILRRVDDHFCDPLELMGRSQLGVPGLLQAVRGGNVAVANALGSGVLQAPGFMPFLPALSRFLLDEDLKMPSVQTWWCGDASSRTYVLEHLHNLVIKSALPVRGEEPVFAWDLTSAEVDKLRAAIIERPERFVGQERVMDRTTPALIDGRLDPRRFVTRAYLAADSSGGYAAMPGGLTRVAASGQTRSVSLQRGAGSKDTWVLSIGPVLPVTLLPSGTQPIPLSRGGGDLPSRLADDLFWLGRYVERVEACSRLARGALRRLLDPGIVDGASLALRLLAGTIVPWHTTPEQVEHRLFGSLFDPTNSSSLPATVASVHRLARMLRDQLSVDAWRVLQAITNVVNASEYAPRQTPEFFDDLIGHCAAFSGLVVDSMTRGQTWLFVEMGRRLERAVTTIRLLRSTLSAGPSDTGLLEAILDVCDSSISYRRRYLTHLETHAVVDLLLCDGSNPRAVAFQLQEMDHHLARLPRDPAQPMRNIDQTQLLRLRASIETADVNAIASASSGPRPALGALLTDAVDRCETLSQTIAQLYFSHSALPHEIGVTPTPPGEGADA
ncbi:MAG: circularly permuted type 2 ATP-grasp protein [Tepidisphaeraceae bacterium]